MGYASTINSCENAPDATLPYASRLRCRFVAGRAGAAAVARSFPMAADRQLLFGLLALQNGLVNQGQLVAAFQAWTLDKGRILAEHLVARGDLDAEDRMAVDALVARHLKRHRDVEQSLAAVAVGRSTRERMAGLDDSEINATLGHLGTAHISTENVDFDHTAAYSVGAATSDGQRFRILRPHAKGRLGGSLRGPG